MSKRILIAEDDRAIQRLILRVLDREGYEIQTASNGQEAMTCIGSQDYDAVVMDLMMPGLSGFDVLARLRSEKPDVLKHLIVITAAAERETRKIPAADVCAIVRKPFDLQQLIDTVRKCADGGDASPAVA